LETLKSRENGAVMLIIASVFLLISKEEGEKKKKKKKKSFSTREGKIPGYGPLVRNFSSPS